MSAISTVIQPAKRMLWVNLKLLMALRRMAEIRAKRPFGYCCEDRRLCPEPTSVETRTNGKARIPVRKHPAMCRAMPTNSAAQTVTDLFGENGGTGNARPLTSETASSALRANQGVSEHYELRRRPAAPGSTVAP